MQVLVPGVVVAAVLPGTPADDAGLAMGDVIVAVNGTDVFSGDELRDLIHEMPDGEEITLRVQRAGAERHREEDDDAPHTFSSRAFSSSRC